MQAFIRAVKTSWIPTVGAIVGFGKVLFTQLDYLFDGDPATVINFDILAVAFSALIIGLSARQSNVSDEQAGAGVKPPPENEAGHHRKKGH